MKASVPKVLLPISHTNGSPETVLERVVNTFVESKECQRIVVCYPPAWRSDFERYQSAFRGLLLVEGGDTRQHSVFNGVKYLASLDGVSGDEVVLVHDAARCSISSAVIERVVRGVEEHGAVTAAVPVADSLCRASVDGVVSGYVDRSSLYAIQTPQGFRLADLLRAHERAVAEGAVALDDAALVAGLREVRVVSGDPRNIKITYPSDLELVREREGSAL